jgi:hypothetical protein
LYPANRNNLLLDRQLLVCRNWPLFVKRIDKKSIETGQRGQLAVIVSRPHARQLGGTVNENARIIKSKRAWNFAKKSRISWPVL